MATKEQISEWQARLEDTFRGPSGVVGERIRLLIESERRYAKAAVAGSYGLTAIMDSFQDFILQTFEEMATKRPRLNVMYGAIVIAAFHRLRNAINAYYQGYPYEGAAGVRTLFEIAWFLGAVLNGHIGHNELFSFAEIIDIQQMCTRDILKAKKEHQEQLDRTIIACMRGEQSGLSQVDQSEIASFWRSLHPHVHRAESSVVWITLDIHETRLISLHPSFSGRRANHFATPMVYVSWLLHRVFPYVWNPLDYSKDWHAKWSVLDESFKFYVESNDSPVAPSFVRMVDLKFVFDPKTCWSRVAV